MRPMSFSDVLRKTWRDNLLFSVLVELTYRCNLDCFFCYNDLGLRGEPLTHRAVPPRSSRTWRDLQVLNLTLSGGEPLAHPDFLRWAPGRGSWASSCGSSRTATPCAARWPAASATRSTPS